MVVRGGREWSGVVRSGWEWSGVVRSGQKWSGWLLWSRVCREWTGVVVSGRKWFRMVRSGWECSSTVGSLVIMRGRVVSGGGREWPGGVGGRGRSRSILL